MSKVVCFGELMVRLTAPDRELLVQARGLDLNFGGAEANVAIGLANLGHRAAMITRLPDNALGEAAIQHLRRYGVDVTGVARTPGRMGLYFIEQGAGIRASSVLYDREDSSFALAGAADFDWDRLLEDADILHVSGVTPALGQRSADAVVAAAEAARARNVRVSFDGNYRSQLWARWDGDPRAILTEVVRRADIMFGNHRDISLLLDHKFSGEGPERRREAAMAAFDAFPNLQTLASTARHIEDSGAHRIAARIDTREGAVQTDEVALADIVDRIGAGDAFAAGVLHGLFSQKDLETTARYGLALTCLKHMLPGDVSLFGQADIDAFLGGERDVRR